MVASINNGLPYIVTHVTFTSIRWKVVDKPLGAGLILFNVNISLEIVLYTCHYKENKNIHKHMKKFRFIRFLEIYLFQFILVFMTVTYAPLSLGDYQYPNWSHGVTGLIWFLALFWIPLWMVITLYKRITTYGVCI